jgi:hypothetical protein
MLGERASVLPLGSRRDLPGSMQQGSLAGPPTRAYLAYALQDVQVTWECYAELSQRYAAHLLTQTPMHRIKSEAGIGKAYLKEMGIQPWRLM